VPRNASKEEIKRRYRELARMYHPDVHPDKAQAHERFVLLTEAYQTLTDPLKRMSYDLALTRAEQARRQMEARRGPRRLSAEDLLVEAEARFFRREFEEAITLCQQALRLDPRNAAVYALLGDIYTELEQLEDAVVMYTYAVQYKPESHLFTQKLQQILELEKVQKESKAKRTARRVRSAASRPAARRPPWAWTVVGVIGAVGLLWWAKQPSEGLWWDLVPPRLLAAGGGLGLILGFLLRRWRVLGPFESEYLLSGIREPYGGVLPVGALVSVASIISFYFAIVLYIVIALMEEQISASVLKLFVVTFWLMALFALLWLPLWKWILLFGGNVLLNAIVLGWLGGEVGMKPWE
jgi:curved DNA-binding protein CbpA